MLLFLVYSNKPSSNATTITKDEVVFYNLDEPLDVFPVDNGYLIKYDSYVKLKTNNSETIIDGKLKCFNFNQDSLFLITEVDKKVILSKVTNNKLVSKQLESNLNINKIIIDNNRLCLFGSCNEFSVIYEYSLDLEVIKQNNYFENCKIEFYDVKKYDDKW